MFLQITCDDAADLAGAGPEIHLRRREGGARRAAISRCWPSATGACLRVHLGSHVAAGLTTLKDARPSRRSHEQTIRRRRMQLGMIGLGRMGGNIVRRLTRKRPPMRGVRPESKPPSRRWSARASPAAPISSNSSGQLEKAARGLGDAAGRRDHRRDGRASRRPAGAGRHHHRRRQLLLQGRYPPRQEAGGEGHSLRRLRHVRRRLGPRARLLHDDRRRQGGRRSPRSDLRGAGARARAISRARRAARKAIPAPSAATSTPARAAPGISSRWSTTASSTA